MNYQKLFNYMFEKHGILLIESEMQEICNIVNDIQQPAIGSVLDEFISDVEHMMKLYGKGRITQAEEWRDKLAEQLDDIMRLGIVNHKPVN